MPSVTRWARSHTENGSRGHILTQRPEATDTVSDRDRKPRTRAHTETGSDRHILTQRPEAADTVSHRDRKPRIRAHKETGSHGHGRLHTQTRSSSIPQSCSLGSYSFSLKCTARQQSSDKHTMPLSQNDIIRPPRRRKHSRISTFHTDSKQ